MTVKGCLLKRRSSGAARPPSATEWKWPLPLHKKVAYALISALLDRLVVNSPEALRFAIATGHILGKKSILRDVDVLARQIDPDGADGAKVWLERGIPPMPWWWAWWEGWTR